jgi:hypothetical protein
MAGAKTKTVQFMEKLPDSCPPPGAGLRPENVYHSSTNPATDEDFASSGARKRNCKNGHVAYRLAYGPRPSVAK